MNNKWKSIVTLSLSERSRSAMNWNRLPNLPHLHKEGSMKLFLVFLDYVSVSSPVGGSSQV